MLRKYIPAVKDFLSYVHSRNLSFNSDEDIDRALTIFLEKGLYEQLFAFDRANAVFFGLLAIFPELGRKLPTAHRAWKAWERQNLGGEGAPIPEQAVELVAHWFAQSDRHDLDLLVRLIFDCYLRSSDWEKLRKEDIYRSGETVAIILGVSERGEKAKTGPNQGVIVDCPLIAEALWSKAQALQPGAVLFSTSPEAFRQQWTRAKAATGLSWIGPPHDLRHGGASRDVEAGTRSLEQVRRRGRWKILDSVQRYTKTWLLVRERGRLTPQQIVQAEELQQERPSRIIHE